MSQPSQSTSANTPADANESSITGSCLCGKVRFRMANRFQRFHQCHCQQCQKATGTAFAANLFTDNNNIQWLEGESLLQRYDVPGRSITSCFCRLCGSPMPYPSLTGSALVVPAGSLEGIPHLQPSANIFCQEQASWYAAGVQAPQLPGFTE